ncbi:hypothetical protein [Streptomyces sp. NPDC093094]|uniref:hypothetical protein n=1 Tax=Streptomyces sp. NPDC093094 TaxID=3366026 RepID=UPI00381F175A
MGRFIQATTEKSNPTASEIACGQALAAITPAACTVVMVDPSGHRGAGATGATGDFMIYTTGGEKETDHETVARDESGWGTCDAYTPKSTTDGEGALKKIANKLDTQARVVIVDLRNFGNQKSRDTLITHVENALTKSKAKKTIIWLNRNLQRRIFNKNGTPFEIPEGVWA